MPFATRLSRNLKTDLLLTFCTVIWGATFVVVKDALGDASVFVFLALRFALAAVLLAAIYWRDLRREIAGSFRSGAAPGGLLIGCFLFSGFAFQTAGIRLTTPSKAAFITGFSAVLVPVLLAIFGAARIRVSVWAGAVSAVLGLYYLAVPASETSNGLWRVNGLSGLNRGDLLVLCAAWLFAMHMITIGHYAPKHSVGALTLIQVATSALLSVIAVFALSRIYPPAARVAWTPRLIAAVLVTAILATVVAFSAQVWAQKNTTATHAAILFTLEPVFAALTSFIFVHERLGNRALLGGALILAGILLAELGGASPAALESLTEPAKPMHNRKRSDD